MSEELHLPLLPTFQIGNQLRITSNGEGGIWRRSTIQTHVQIYTHFNCATMIEQLIIIIPWAYDNNNNRLTVFHEFHVLDKTSNDKVMTESTSGVKSLLQVSAERQWCRHSGLIILLSHISFPFWWRWRKFRQNIPATLAWKSVLVSSGLTWYIDVKRWW